jgi:hypothetical protein
MKQPISLSETQYETILESLESTLNVLNNVDYECDNMNPKNVEKTAPYAVGFSRSAVNELISTLKAIQSLN